MAKLKDVINRNKYVTEERRARGDFFNVFSIMRKETDEVHTHSAMICELLDPQGSHGLGNRFLMEFINIVIPSNEKFSVDDEIITVKPEHNIGNISDDGNEGGQIDVFIEARSNIIIENKINAEDQTKQLLRYYNYAKKSKKDFVLFYLTLNGEEADEKSTKGKDLCDNEITLKPITPHENDGHYYVISYKEHIREWLEQCWKLSVDYPTVRETIKQYLNLIKKLTNMDDNMGQELKKYLLDNDNLKYTAQLLDLVYGDLKCEVMETFASSIIEELNNQYDAKWSMKVDNDGTCRFYPNKWPVNSQNYNKSYFPICFHSDGTLFLEQYGITKDSYVLSDEIEEIRKKGKLNQSENCKYIFKGKIDGTTIWGRHSIIEGKKFEKRISGDVRKIILEYIDEVISFINVNQPLLRQIEVSSELYFGYRYLNEILTPINKKENYE